MNSRLASATGMTIPHIPDKVLVAENRALQNPHGISGLFAEPAAAG